VGTLSAANIVGFGATTPGVPTQRDSEDIWDEPVDPGDDEFAGSTFFLDLWEDAGAELSGRFSASSSPEWDVLEEHTVAEAMSRDILTVPMSASVAIAADYMRRSGAHRVLVIEGETLRGVVTTMDITRYVASRPDED
jgi:hypothetical protein